MSKHTPGPWVHNADDNIITTTGGKLTLEWVARSNHIWSGGIPVAERDANARLVAAAPELLEALQELLHEVGFGRILSDTVASTKARAAIAKATGEQA